MPSRAVSRAAAVAALRTAAGFLVVLPFSVALVAFCGAWAGSSTGRVAVGCAELRGSAVGSRSGVSGSRAMAARLRSRRLRRVIVSPWSGWSMWSGGGVVLGAHLGVGLGCADDRGEGGGVVGRDR